MKTQSKRSTFERLEARQLFSAALNALPSPWSDSDIGAVGKTGSAIVNSAGSFVVAGSGADIWNAADAFNYAYQPLSGDGTVITQVTGETNTNGFAKAGVMIRTDLSTGSTFAFLFVSPQYGISFQARNVAKQTPTSAATSVPGVIPKWLELVRTGQLVKAYYSSDGATWALDGSVTLPGAGPVYAGLAVTAHNNSAINTSTFAGAAVIAAGSTTVAPAAPTAFTATAVSGTDVHLSWTPADLSATSFVVQRKGPTDTNFVTIATPTSATTSLDDLNVTAGQSYSYQIMAVNLAGSSAFTAATAVTTPAPVVVVVPPPLVTPPVVTPVAPVTPVTPVAPVTPTSSVWADMNIGSVGMLGSASQSGSVFTVTGSGTDIWAAPDVFNFDEQSFTGNGSAVARMVSNSSTNSGSKAGIMFRETNATDSRYVDMVVTPNKMVQFQYRSATHNSSSYIATTGGAGTYLKLTRSGNVFTGYYSSDGVTWKQLGTATLNLVNDIQVGMAVCSHNNVQLAMAKFDNVGDHRPTARAGVGLDRCRHRALLARWESATRSTYNNKLYVFGGFDDRTLDSTAESDVYDPSTNTWTTLTPIPTGGLSHASAAVVGNTMYLAGGDIGTFNARRDPHRHRAGAHLQPRHRHLGQHRPAAQARRQRRPRRHRQRAVQLRRHRCHRQDRPERDVRVRPEQPRRRLGRPGRHARRPASLRLRRHQRHRLRRRRPARLRANHRQRHRGRRVQPGH